MDPKLRGKHPDASLIRLLRVIASGDAAGARRVLAASPALATTQVSIGASAESAGGCFLAEIQHYFYGGDTALHIAAASYSPELVSHLIGLGASCAARNRRGAEPLHYASDTNHDDPRAQARVIEGLVAAGANPNAIDKSGIAPLHRAVRTRGVAAVAALLGAGANPRLKNKNGSTPLHLAVQNTGRGGTGTAKSMERQKEIISLLLARGALATDKDGRGRTVTGAATADRIMHRLATTLFFALAALTPAAAQSIPDHALAHPIFRQYYSCGEHAAGELKYQGDDLGTDCVIAKLVEIEGRNWVRAYQGNGERNEDWFGWRQDVLAPCTCEVLKVSLNPEVNLPGILGKPPASIIVFRRDDHVHFILAHVAEVTVKAGQKVQAGEKVAVVGNNGMSRSPHIHVGAWKGSQALQVRFDLTALGAIREQNR